MPWFWVDDAFADSKPVMALDRSLRNEAIGLWVRCGAWSAKEETDGRVSVDTVKSFDGTPRLIRALHEQAGLWVESSPESWRISRQILFGNWEKWQKTKAENEAKRIADAARQANHRKAKKGRGYIPSAAVSSDDSETSRRESQRDSNNSQSLSAQQMSRCESQRPDPDPTRPDPNLLVTSGGGVTSVDARDPRPQCPRHTENHSGPCPDCRRRREWDEAQAARAEADELARRRARREAIDACTLCDQNGKREIGSNTVIDCNHDPEARHA